MPRAWVGRDLRFGGVGFIKLMMKAGWRRLPQLAKFMASEAAYGGSGKNDEWITEAL